MYMYVAIEPLSPLGQVRHQGSSCPLNLIGKCRVSTHPDVEPGLDKVPHSILQCLYSNNSTSTGVSYSYNTMTGVRVHCLLKVPQTATEVYTHYLLQLFVNDGCPSEGVVSLNWWEWPG